jgi:uncharacterized protein (DUF488 family)
MIARAPVLRGGVSPDAKLHRVTVFTIGHSTRPIGAFIELLAAHGVQHLIDVRKIPQSGHNPQFGREQLSASLEEAGIHYTHMPGLGGLRRARKDSTNTGWRNASFRGYADYMQTREFEENVERCVDLAKEERTALMCAESVPWRCHRSLIADALVARGIDVREITSTTDARPHALTPWARVEGTTVTYPGLPLTS